VKATINVCRKVSDNNYGSYGASVTFEAEIDTEAYKTRDQFNAKLDSFFAFANEALDRELSRQGAKQPAQQPAQQPARVSHSQVNSPRDSRPQAAPAAGRGGQQAVNSGNSGNSGSGPRPASEKQINFAKVLSRKIEGMGVSGMERLARKLFQQPVAALTSMNAASLIDTLKAIGDGEISLAQAMA
jgi:hypothetical protein